MSNVTLAYRNILETGTVTSTDENTSFPRTRLYDRDIEKLFKFNSHAANLYVVVNQGAIISYEVDRLIIPVGHTLNGLNLKLQYSTTGAWAGEQVDALSWAQADALIINKPFTAQTKQYWRFLITSDPAAAPEIPELYLTDDIVLTDNPLYQIVVGVKKNVTKLSTLSGKTLKIKLGVPKISKRYNFLTTTTQKTALEAWDSHCEGTKSFYLLDEDGNLLFAEALSDFEFTHAGPDMWACSVDLLQAL